MSRPENWRGTGIKPKAILAVATQSGIPVAWVPPASVLRMLVSAPPAARIAILRAHTADVLAQCDELLNECRDNWLGDGPVLVKRAIDAFKAGHHEAAMALAVAVSDSLAAWALEQHVHVFESEAEKEEWEKQRKKKGKGSLAEMELAAVGTGRELKRLEVLRHALIIPIPKFFTPYYGQPGEAMPNTASRHATVHRPTVSHLTRDNALLAIMFCISILRAQQAWCEELHDEEAHAEWLAQEQ